MCADWVLGFTSTISDLDRSIERKRTGRSSCFLIRLLVRGMIVRGMGVNIIERISQRLYLDMASVKISFCWILTKRLRR